jgi:hypothetical protein
MSDQQVRPFRILSLDGGGIRGTFTAAFLAEIETRLGRPIADYFDLIAGTSTGGIIAAALSLREPAEKVERFYRDRGPEIFQRRPDWTRARWAKPLIWAINKFLATKGLDYDYLIQSKYDGCRLRSALDEVFGNRTMGDCTTRVVIPSVDLIRGQTVVFKTPHLPTLFRDRTIRLVHVLLSTSAAPTYFPHSIVQTGSAYVDGGVWANNPSMVAYAEALKIGANCRRQGVDQPFEWQNISLLSVGTGRPVYALKPPAHGAGLAWWGPRLFNVVAISQAQGIDFQMRYILDERYRRIDYDIPDTAWSLDNVGPIDNLVHLGHQRATDAFLDLRKHFFTEAAPRFEPFLDAAAA